MRFRFSVGILLSMGVPVALAQTGSAVGSSDLARLIEGVKEVAAPGAPGALAVFAPTAVGFEGRATTFR